MTTEGIARLRRAALMGDVDSLLQTGWELLGSGRESEALPIIEHFTESHSGESPIHLLVGMLYRDIGDFGSSFAALNRAAEISPNNVPILTNRAFVALEAGLPALDLFKHTRSLSPNDDNLLLGLVAAMVSEGKTARAVDLLERELRRKPQWLKGHMRLSQLRWSNGDSAGFARSFAYALAKHARDVSLWREYIQTFLQADMYDRALEIVANARTAAGDHPSFDAAEAICRSNLGDTEIADALFNRLSTLNDASLTEYHVRHLLRIGRVQEAASLSESFLSKSLDHRFWPYLSVAWRLMGDPRWEWLEGDPSFIGVYDIADRLPPLDLFAGNLQALHKNRSQPLHQSLRGGTQTDGHLFHRVDPQIVQLRLAITDCIRDYVGRLPPFRQMHPLLGNSRSPIRFSGSWSVRLMDGGRHVNHFHRAGWISSAFYVQLPENLGNSDTEEGWLTLGQASELGVDLPPLRSVEPRPGRLVLFPSTMWHGTRPFQDGERLTVAFDVERPV